MDGISEIAVALMGLILALWAGGAAWAIWAAMDRRSRAEHVLRQSGRLTRLLETSPALPMIVRADGRIEASQRIMGWFGFTDQPGHLSELHGQGIGLNRQDMDALISDVALVQKSGHQFTRSVRVQGSERVLLVRGELADTKVASNHSALLWIFDATGSETAIAQLRSAKEEAERAFAALAAVIESAPLPMWYASADGQLQLVNSAYVAAVARDNAEAVIAEQVQLIEAEPAAVTSNVRDIMAGGVTVRDERALTIAGHRRRVQLVQVPIGSEGVAAYVIDIQDIADAQRRLSAFDAAQRSLLDRLSSAVAQFDSNGQLSFCNIPFQRIFSLRQQWLVERPEFPRVLDRMREVNRLPQVRDFAAWRSERQDWFSAREPVEEDWVLPDSMHLHVVASPTSDHGLIIIFEDRTEQIKLASARDTLLRARTATFNNLFEALAVFSADGRLQIWNSQFQKHWDFAEDYLAKHPHIDSLMQHMAKCLRSPARISEIRVAIRVASTDRDEAGGRFHFADQRVWEYSAIPLPDGNAMLTMLDISDSFRIEQALRERSDALEEADSIKARFLANMSYELRTPLTSIGGFAEMLHAGVAGDLSEQARDYVAAILESTDKLQKQINTILDLSQSEAGSLPLALETTDIAAFLNQICTSFAGSAAAAKVELHRELRPDLGQADIDQRRLAQALGELIDNALRYCGEGGRVLVHAQGDDKLVEINISDNGPGMSAGEISRAMDSFGRSRAADQSADKGRVQSGLGLPLARQLVEAHGGEFSLLSEKGQGTNVCLRLPRHAAAS